MSFPAPARQPRGARRRQAILDAALQVVSDRGVAHTTHRAVADEAGVPLAATTYYFGSLDQLLEESLRGFVEDETSRLSAVAERLAGRRLPPLETASLFRAELGPSIAQFELYLEASRRPRLREVARECIELYTRVAEAALRNAGAEHPESYGRAFVALFDGYGLQRAAGADDQGLDDALMALWAAATRAIGTR